MYDPFGWKHYARDRKTLRRTFVSSGIMFFNLKDIFSWGFILCTAWWNENYYEKKVQPMADQVLMPNQTTHGHPRNESILGVPFLIVVLTLSCCVAPPDLKTCIVRFWLKRNQWMKNAKATSSNRLKIMSTIFFPKKSTVKCTLTILYLHQKLGWLIGEGRCQAKRSKPWPFFFKRRNRKSTSCTKHNLATVKNKIGGTSLIKQVTPSIAEIICVKNVGAIVVCGFFMK